MLKEKKAFSLIELLVVVSIIGVLTTISIFSLSSARRNARDTERISDIKQIQAALELYRANEGNYPTTITSGGALKTTSTTYMNNVPTNPNPVSSNTCTETNYSYSGNSYTYTLDFCLENATGSVGAGNHCATPSGITDTTCTTPPGSTVCDTNFIDPRDSQSYPIVQIGTQCWFAKNLNVGTMVNSSTDQGDYSAGIQKYCDNNSESICTTDGGLYQWHMAVGLPQSCDSSNNSPCNISSAAQGICPTGWHIPSDTEWTNLETYLGGSSVAGGKLKEAGTTNWNSPNTGATNSSGFTALGSGYRNAGGSFGNQGMVAYFWSSLPYSNNPSGAFSRYLTSNSSGATRNYLDRAYGFSVRCLQD